MHKMVPYIIKSRMACFTVSGLTPLITKGRLLYVLPYIFYFLIARLLYHILLNLSIDLHKLFAHFFFSAK